MTNKQCTVLTIVGIANLMLMIFVIFIGIGLASDLVQQSDRIDDLKNRITQSAYRDSLVMQHYGTCSFISMDDVAIGYDGHFYSVDWRRRHGRESKTNN